MSLQLIEKDGGRTLELEMSGTLADGDFKILEPAFVRLIKQHGKIRVLVLMQDFQGWDGIALWDEIKFDVKHLRDIDRLALVGDKQWERFLSVFQHPFTSAEVRYFDKRQVHEARAWLENKVNGNET